MTDLAIERSWSIHVMRGSSGVSWGLDLRSRVSHC